MGDDNTLKIWDAESGKERYTLRGHFRVVTSCSFSPDGASVLSGSDDKTLKIWDAATGARLCGALRWRLMFWIGHSLIPLAVFAVP